MKYFSSVASAPIKKVLNTFVGSPLSIGARINLKKVLCGFHCVVIEVHEKRTTPFDAVQFATTS